MTLDVNGQVEGFDALQTKIEQMQRDIAGDPMKQAMGKATMLVTRDARKNAPVDRGTLRASIVPEVITRDRVVQGIVGSNVKYAPYQEFGTRPFWPPWIPLFQWAQRKTRVSGANARQLAAGARIAISRRGIKALRYLQRALEDNAPKIYRIIGGAVGKIVRK